MHGTQIPEIKAFSCNGDAGLDDARNHDYGIVADFDNAADYNVYAAHPAHVAAITGVIKPVLAAGGRHAVQFEVPSSGSSGASGDLIRHIVLLKFKKGTDKQAAAASITTALAPLSGAIPEIQGFTCGVDAGLDDARNHDYAIVGDFANADTYNVYASHATHIAAIVDFIKPVLAAGGRHAVQFAVSA